MTPLTDDTIAAIASAPGGAPRGVLRMSGPRALACLRACFAADEAEDARGGSPTADRNAARTVRGRLRLPEPLAPIRCEAYIWPTDRSYTRQPAVELHMPGSPPLLEAALEALCRAGARLAGPGEFTLRAFLAGRLDLTQAEAVLGVIDAEDRRELDVALEQLSGGLAGPLHALRDQLLDLLAHLEAGLDFVDEEIEFITAEALRSQLDQAAAAIDRLSRQMTAREETSAEPRVVLRGWPNVGKSSLLNALAQEPAALVSETAGTTRDFLSCRMELDGTCCLLIDTAGVEPAVAAGLTAHAQSMTARQRAQAQLELLCLDATRPRNAWEAAELEQTVDRPRLIVWTKADRLPLEARGGEGIWTSSLTGEGLDALRRALTQRLAEGPSSEHGFVASTSVRCRESLRAAGEGLRRARKLAEAGLGEELVAAEVRLSLDELGKTVGAVYTDDVLDRIFSRFCIGK